MLIYFVIGFCLIWLVFLSGFVYKIQRHYRKLLKTTKKEKIDEILERLIDEGIKNKKTLERLGKEIEGMKTESRYYIQKIGLVRFNPFREMGGEQSFVVSLLDKTDNGLVINFIYTREGIRVYSKRIKKGEGENFSLSEEEKKAISRAETGN